jgi:hypothetical protein
MYNSDTFLILCIVLVVLSSVGGFLYYRENNKGHSLEQKNFLNKMRLKENKRLYSGSCGPGCEYQCNHGERCPNMEIKSSNLIKPNSLPQGQSISKKPILTKNLDLGYATNINHCSSNVNGVMKLKNHNRYGKVYPEGEQMYSFCVKGSNNPFDD